MAPTPTVADRDERALDEPANPVLVQLDGVWRTMEGTEPIHAVANVTLRICLLYTSDAADDLLCVASGGRRIIKKKTLNE